LQSAINYGLKFSGVVVTIVGRECVPINPKISVGRTFQNQAFYGAVFGDHGPRLTVVAFWSAN
jgi:hypothetical protein